MGIDCALRQLLRQRFAPAAFSCVPPRQRYNVVLDDLMTRVYFAYGQSANGSFTGREFYDHFFSPVREALWSGKTKVYVGIADCSLGVPKQKASEQASRSQAAARSSAPERSVKPYAANCKLTDDGISAPDGSVETFTASRLFHTRSLRPQIWAYVMSQLRKETWPDDTCFVFDFDFAGPWLFRPGQAPEQRLDLAHQLGEADLAMPYWCWKLQDYDVVIDTIDTDILPIMVAYLLESKGQAPKQLHWRFPEAYRSDEQLAELELHRQAQKAWASRHKKGSQAPLSPKPEPPAKKWGAPAKQLVWVDLLQVYDKVGDQSLQGLQLTPQRFVAWCVLNGTDFVKKKWLSHYCNPEIVLEALRRFPQLDSLDLSEQQGVELWHSYCRLLLTIQLHSSKKLLTASRKPNAGPIELQASQANVLHRSVIEAALPAYAHGCRWPDVGDFLEADRLVRWNLHYWTKSWQQHSLQRQWCTLLPTASSNPTQA